MIFVYFVVEKTEMEGGKEGERRKEKIESIFVSNYGAKLCVYLGSSAVKPSPKISVYPCPSVVNPSPKISVYQCPSVVNPPAGIHLRRDKKERIIFVSPASTYQRLAVDQGSGKSSQSLVNTGCPALDGYPFRTNCNSR